ncbi:MAG: hypothetical protein RPT25_00620 [Cycloclasticus sp.]|jgi:hypothetical protein
MASVVMSKHCKEHLKELKDENPEKLRQAFEKLELNFLKPVSIDYTTNELEGKYKPSWELRDTFSSKTQFREQFASLSREYNLHHYHYGFPYYQEGRDKVYPGKESDGIVHTTVLADGRHAIYQVDLKHPNPWRIPLKLEL